MLRFTIWLPMADSRFADFAKQTVALANKISEKDEDELVSKAITDFVLALAYRNMIARAGFDQELRHTLGDLEEFHETQVVCYSMGTHKTHNLDKTSIIVPLVSPKVMGALRALLQYAALGRMHFVDYSSERSPHVPTAPSSSSTTTTTSVSPPPEKKE